MKDPIYSLFKLSVQTSKNGDQVLSYEASTVTEAREQHTINAHL